jgi:hypothetical protein
MRAGFIVMLLIVAFALCGVSQGTVAAEAPRPGAPAKGEPQPAPPVIEPAIEAAFQACEDKYKRDLKSLNKEERIEAVRAYANTNHPTAVRRILPQLEQKDPAKEIKGADFRYAILSALGRFTYPAAVKLVREVVLPLSKPDQLFDCYLVLRGMAKSATPETSEIVMLLATGAKSTQAQRTAALEAMGERGNNAWSDTLWELIRLRDPKWDAEDAIVGVTAYSAFARCHKQTENPKERLPVLRELLEHVKLMLNDRVKFAAASCFAKVSRYGEATDDTTWLEWYLVQIEGGVVKADGKIPEAKMRSRRTDKMEFLGMQAVGRRIVFCIDLSDSMNLEVTPQVRKEYEDKINAPPKEITGGKKKDDDEPKEPDETRNMPIKTRLDIAKIELIKALNRLEHVEKKRIESLKEKKKSGTRAGLKALEDPYKFNIVSYNTNSGLLDPKTESFTPATHDEIKRFKDIVLAIEKGGEMTNIHGALLDAFQITLKEKVKGDPSVNSECVLGGADTVYFLTDG